MAAAKLRGQCLVGLAREILVCLKDLLRARWVLDRNGLKLRGEGIPLRAFNGLPFDGWIVAVFRLYRLDAEIDQVRRGMRDHFGIVGIAGNLAHREARACIVDALSPDLELRIGMGANFAVPRPAH